MKRLLASAIFFPMMVALDSWIFRAQFEMSYVDWYIANGSLISATASLFTVVWKSLNDTPALISADPRNFLAANLNLVGTQLLVIGHHLEETGNYFRANRGVPFLDLVDGVAGMMAALVMLTAMVVWCVAIVPLQYFVVILAGAPARLALKVRARRSLAGGHGETMADSGELAKWEGNLVSAPVAMTNAMAALILLIVKLARAA